MSTTRTDSSLDELRFRLHGGVHEPGDASYRDACTLFNTMIDRRPRIVAECVVVDDVVAALAFARDHELPVAVRSGGHSVAGLSLCDDGVVLDVRGMNGVDVDAARRTVRVGGGATAADMDRATQVHGLATTGGRVSTTGVAGLTLGGGSGWLERKHGLACDNLVAAELVTWDGRIVRASADENRELLWALRGGGGSFGVVTALELELHPLGPAVWAGVALFERARAREVMRAFRDVMNGAAGELSLACAFITAPEDDDVPAELRGRPAIAVLGMWAGGVADGERALAPIRALGPAADFFGPTTYAEFQCSVDDPPGYRNYWTAESVVDLPDAAVDVLVARAAELPAGPSQVFVVAWGGAVRRAGPEHSPLAGREARFIVHPLLLWDDPRDDARCRTLARAFGGDMKPWSTGAAYPNFLGAEGGSRMTHAFGASGERLVAVKADWDPHGVFRTHQAVRELAAGGGPTGAAAPAVRKATTEDVERIARVLAQAFLDDPVSAYFFPDPSDRLHRLERMYGSLVLPRLALPHDETYTTETVIAAALWTPPGAWQLRPLDSVRLLPVMAAVWRRGLARAIKAMAFMDRHHPGEPHLYLPFLGVLPEWQGRGIGTALMRPMLARCDREGLPAYLEATTPRNVALYRRNGFAVVDEIRLPDDGPPLWRMWRAPA
ncbi:MAG: GNAT family N-acetyltransferase [Solirubrobacteraceae bacterium]|nr:GNAT family N-acetyltransferase [Solirubrobacteraceae bacterium]